MPPRWAEAQNEAIGRDALVFSRQSEERRPDADRDQLIAIYTGKAVNWKDVGGADLPSWPISALKIPEAR
jgi:ABC-type phosphate transport system substrate-binding protein